MLHKVMCLVWFFMRSCMNLITLRDISPHAEAHHGMGLLLKCVIIVTLQILHVTFHIFIKVYLRSESSQQKMKFVIGSTTTVTKLPDAKLLWLLFLGAEKPLVRQFGVEGDFHPFRPLLQCHNNL